MNPEPLTMAVLWAFILLVSLWALYDLWKALYG